MAALPESAEVANGDKTESAFVQCKTSAGSFAMKFQREWAPNGYDRSVRLFERGFYDSTHFYRVVPNFLTQFGIT
jgi:cyclophilin family peptidyl-prolyl cis-trans isomerase